MLDGLAAEADRVEHQVEACGQVLVGYERDRIELEQQVRQLEAQLETIRQARIEAYTRWWNAREDRDRALHLARRLRRRIDRAQRRRTAPLDRPAEG
ncbi:hypothetical protein [Nocardiopsis ansamitocini]|uniref:hypothetical protein n=1 Tax=Nocardiopsis ansamitocini TaxID=1670832 RepID=UPI003D7FC3EC